MPMKLQTKIHSRISEEDEQGVFVCLFYKPLIVIVLVYFSLSHDKSKLDWSFSWRYLQSSSTTIDPFAILKKEKKLEITLEN